MAREYDDRDFFPSAKVKLNVRLEEFDRPVFDLKKLPPRNATTLAPSKDKPALDVVADPNIPGAFLLQSKNPSTPGTGQTQTSSADLLTYEIPGLIPKQASLGYNGVRIADTLSLTIKWTDCPIDPRCIRSASVEYYLGALTSSEFAEGARGVTRATAQGNVAIKNSAEKLNIVADGYTHAGIARTNLRFSGWVDDWEVTMNDGEPEIKLECRDNTQLLIDQKAPQKPRITRDGSKIDKSIATYLAFFPQFEGLSVQFRPTDTQDRDKPSLKDSLDGALFSSNLGGGPPPSKGGGSSEGMSVWDYLTDVCGAMALNVRVEGNLVVIESPKTLMNDQTPPRVSDPYRTRRVESGTYSQRTFIYGRNVSEMSFGRKYDKKSPGNIEVRCTNPKRKNVLVGRYPNKTDRVISANPGDGAADQKWKVIRVSLPLKDQAAAEKLAKAYYVAKNRTEFEAKIKTRDLTSFAGDALDTDILDARPGDGISLLIDHAGDGTVVTVDGFMDQLASNKQYMTDMGFSDAFASAYADARARSQFPRSFILRSMKIEWDIEKGVDIDMTCANYLTARLEPDDFLK